MQSEQKTILVSGGAGYIGSHAVRALQKAGYRTIVLDNLITGHLWAAQKADVFVKGDIGDASLLAELCKAFHPLAAFHFAASIEASESLQKPQEYFANNRDKAAVFFEALASGGVRNVVFSSTASVYGEASEGAALREESPLAPCNPYGQSKREAEEHLRLMTGLRSVTFRYFNAVGAAPEAGLGEAHSPETHLLPRVILPLIDTPDDVLGFLGLREGFKIFGADYPTQDGTSVRDYVHVEDLASAHVLALDYLLRGGKTDVFNLGSGKGFSVRAIVDRARKVLNRPDFSPENAPRRAGDPAILVAKSEKAEKTLGWKRSKTIEDALRDAVAWHRTGLYKQTIRERKKESS